MYASSGCKPPRHEELCEPTDPTSRAVRAIAEGRDGSQHRGSRGPREHSSGHRSDQIAAQGNGTGRHLWRYNSNLVFKPGEVVDMDLLAESRSLIYTGKLLHQPDMGFEWSGWSVVMTKLKEKDGITKYHHGIGLLFEFGGGNGDAAQANTPGVNPEPVTDSRAVYPCTILHTGRLGGLYTLQEAIGLRKVVQESNKVFEVETLSSDTFFVPSMLSAPGNQYVEYRDCVYWEGHLPRAV
ncbi:hypothetical protein BGW80DRAFT_1366979, partial [Lactifluus volemus]